MNQNYNSGGGSGDDKKNSRVPQPVILLLVFILLAMFFTSLVYNRASSNKTEVPYTEFYRLVTSDQVEKATINRDRIEFTLKDNASYKNDKAQENSKLIQEATGQEVKTTYFTAYIQDSELIPAMKQHNVVISGKLNSDTTALIYNIASMVIPLALLWILFAFLMRRMGGGLGMNPGKSNAKVYVEKSTGVKFKDVAGQDEAKESLVEVVDFLHNPRKYIEIGAKLPKGALLVGPPGTGKTLLAKAVAGEAGVPFFSLAGSDFVEMFVGVGASRVRDLFKEAQKQAPCIIFIDEIDAIGKSRDSRFGGGNDEREQTLNQLLAEMDGFDTSKGLLVLAATNRPEVLDKALLRPGRFDRRIIVDRPDQKGRLATLKVHAKDVPMDETVDLDSLATASAGLVGSDLANIINEAAICAVKHGRKFVSQKDLFEAFELVAVGGREKKNQVMSDQERKIVAYHEVGHALLAALQKNTEPVQKITIVPRTMGALGYTLQTPEEEKFLETKEELQARIATLMGGRAAEMVVFGSMTSGAANDIEQATNIARAMVTRFGMSDKFGMMGLATVESQYLDGRAALNCGENTAAQIDDEVLSIINQGYDEAVRLLTEHRNTLDRIADFLYEKETITGKQFMKIFRQLEGLPQPQEDQEAVSFVESAMAMMEADRASQAGKSAGEEGDQPSAGQVPESGYQDRVKEFKPQEKEPVSPERSDGMSRPEKETPAERSGEVPGTAEESAVERVDAERASTGRDASEESRDLAEGDPSEKEKTPAESAEEGKEKA